MTECKDWTDGPPFPRRSSSFDKTEFKLTSYSADLTPTTVMVPAAQVPALIIWNQDMTRDEDYLLEVLARSRLRVAIYGELVPPERRNTKAQLWSMSVSKVNKPIIVFPQHIRFYSRPDGYVHYQDSTVFRGGTCWGRMERIS